MRSRAHENRTIHVDQPDIGPAIKLIDGIVRGIARRHHASAEEAAELRSRSELKLVEHDYAVLTRFAGRSSLSTYLTTVVHRLLIDLRRERWGTWRPSAAARRLGPVGVRLEGLIHRDGRSLEEAVRTMSTPGVSSLTPEELEAIASQLPRRVTVRVEGEEALAGAAVGPDVAEARLRAREKAEQGQATEAALRSALAALTPRERLILRLRFHDGFTVRQIATTVRIEEKPLYREFERLFARMRIDMERRGISAADMADLLGSSDWEPQPILVDAAGNARAEDV
jgi:RNA polymerase sigma factor (sigma-70 family)